MVFFIGMRIATLFCSVNTFRHDQHSIPPPPRHPQRGWGGGGSLCLSPSVVMILSTHPLRDGWMDFSENLYTYYSQSENVHLEFSYQLIG